MVICRLLVLTQKEESNTSIIVHGPISEIKQNFTSYLHLEKKLPSIREQLEKDLAKPGLPLIKLLAAVVMIMQQTSIRVGNSMYEKLYGSFGLTTMKDKHVKVNGSSVQFSFKGKKGIYHEIDL